MIRFLNHYTYYRLIFLICQVFWLGFLIIIYTRLVKLIYQIKIHEENYDKVIWIADGKGLSQRNIAKILNISQGTYNNWENGKTEPSIAQLIELSKFFEISVDYLISNSDDAGIINYNKSITEYEKALLDNFNQLPPTLQNNIFELIQNYKSVKN